MYLQKLLSCRFGNHYVDRMRIPSNNTIKSISVLIECWICEDTLKEKQKIESFNQCLRRKWKIRALVYKYFIGQAIQVEISSKERKKSTVGTPGNRWFWKTVASKVENEKTMSKVGLPKSIICERIFAFFERKYSRFFSLSLTFSGMHAWNLLKKVKKKRVQNVASSARKFCTTETKCQPRFFDAAQFTRLSQNTPKYHLINIHNSEVC